MADDAPAASSYLAHLPALFHDDPHGTLGRFLLAFEQVLTGHGDPAEPGLEEIIGGIADGNGREVFGGLHRYIDPGYRGAGRQGQATSCRAPAEFLDWLSNWVAVSLYGDLAEDIQRVLIARAVELYRIRGTRRGLEEVLAITTGQGVTVEELAPPMQVGKACTVGVDTGLTGGLPHFFRVIVRLNSPDPHLRERILRIARAVIEREKPAHCAYAIKLISVPFRVGKTSTIGVDTGLQADAGSSDNEGTP